MKINGPLVIDVSLWDDHLNIQELIDGGVSSVIVGLYKMFLPSGLFELNMNSQRLLDQVSKSNLILQTYYYYYPDKDPYVEANWYVDAMKGYPVKHAWADCEAHGVVMDAKVRSEKYRMFSAQVKSRFDKFGVYTNRSFIYDWAPEMNLWLYKYPAWIPHYGYQPAVATQMTWLQLKNQWLPTYDIIVAAGQTNVVGHQFTGDKCILPGVYTDTNVKRTLDVSEFIPEFIASIGNYTPPPPPMSVEERLVRLEKKVFG
jgi:hypothetical protein